MHVMRCLSLSPTILSRVVLCRYAHKSFWVTLRCHCSISGGRWHYMSAILSKPSAPRTRHKLKDQVIVINRYSKMPSFQSLPYDLQCMIMTELVSAVVDNAIQPRTLSTSTPCFETSYREHRAPAEIQWQRSLFAWNQVREILNARPELVRHTAQALDAIHKSYEKSWAFPETMRRPLSQDPIEKEEYEKFRQHKHRLWYGLRVVDTLCIFAKMYVHLCEYAQKQEGPMHHHEHEESI